MRSVYNKVIIISGADHMNQKFTEYFQDLKNKKIDVIGLGVSNTPLVRLLCAMGISVTARDRASRDKIQALADELESMGAKLVLGDDYLENLDGDVIFRTPGLRPDTPQLKSATDKGAVLTSEMEAFFEVCPCRIIAVTGSDGKTTTTTVISELLKKAGYTVHIGGNIGRPLLSDAKDIAKEDIAVLELSSFQLMGMKHSPDIAVITNISPNHLDYHKDYNEYITAKKSIFSNQGPQGVLVINADNEITRSFAGEAPGEVRMFSRLEEVSDGVYQKGGEIISSSGNGQEKILEVSDILLPGTHNIENYMAAFAAVRGLVGFDICRQVAEEFAGVEHRIELVRRLGGVSYYNDSIASSPTRTIAGLRSFSQKLILIAGGYDKKIPFDVLGPEIVEHVKLLVLTGATSSKIRESVEKAPGYTAGKPEIIEIDDFETAVRTASAKAGSGDIVILSPACASFDKFKNFAERGNTFKKIISSL